MSNGYKHKTEGGQGGKRGHSNMTHWTRTEEIKAMSKKARRQVDAAESLHGIWAWMTDAEFKAVCNE